jgi:hypothetical protein
MSPLKPVVQEVVGALLATSEVGGRVSVDAIAEQVGSRAVTQLDIEAIFDALEAQGREVWAPEGGDGVALLDEVLRAARSLRSAGQAASPQAIATALERAVTEVHRALLFGKILGK